MNIMIPLVLFFSIGYLINYLFRVETFKLASDFDKNIILGYYDLFYKDDN